MSPDHSAAISEPQILDQVARILVEIIGEEYAIDLDIGMDTSFSEGLELESIEFVMLAERLQEHYGDGVDFAAFIADKEIEEIIAMTVGDVVSHVATSLADG